MTYTTRIYLMKRKKKPTDLPATKEAAEALGLKQFLGSPCRAYGHHSGRNVRNGSCIVCAAARDRAAYKAEGDAQQAAWAAQRTEEARQAAKEASRNPAPPPDWMPSFSEPTKAKRIHRRPGEAYAGEAEGNRAKDFRDIAARNSR